MSQEDDDRLLESLGKALAPPPAEPSEVEIEGLRRAVGEGFVQSQSQLQLQLQLQKARPARGFGAWWGRNRRQLGGRRAVFALVAAMALTTTGTAVAVGAGARITAPLRRVARAVGLPVASPAMARTKEAMGRLRAALFARNEGDVRQGAEELRSRAEELDQAERAAVLAEKEALLAEADRFLKALETKVQKRKKARSTAPPEHEGPEDHENEPEAPLFEEDDEEGPSEDEDHPGKQHEFEWRGPRPGEVRDEHDDRDDDDDDHEGGGPGEDDHNDGREKEPEEPPDM
jgi:hypothetical protein